MPNTYFKHYYTYKYIKVTRSMNGMEVKNMTDLIMINITRMLPVEEADVQEISRSILRICIDTEEEGLVRCEILKMKEEVIILGKSQ